MSTSGQVDEPVAAIGLGEGVAEGGHSVRDVGERVDGGMPKQHRARRARGDLERERDVRGDAGVAQRGVEVALRKDVACVHAVGEERVREGVSGEREQERSDDPVGLRQEREPFVDAVHADR